MIALFLPLSLSFILLRDHTISKTDGKGVFPQDQAAAPFLGNGIRMDPSSTLNFREFDVLFFGQGKTSRIRLSYWTKSKSSAATVLLNCQLALYCSQVCCCLLVPCCGLLSADFEIPWVKKKKVFAIPTRRQRQETRSSRPPDSCLHLVIHRDP